ncbi:hypothetical protein [Phormidesmis sp. 146-33]
MSLNLPLKWQAPILAVIFTVTCLPAAISLYRQSQLQLDQQQVRQQKETDISAETAEALKRAERCQPIDERYPLVEGGNAYYSPEKRANKRLLPTRTTLCSISGSTAIVDAEGTVRDIKSAPREQIIRILKQRGLI